MNPFDLLSRFTPWLFRPIRRAVGPLHRRRSSLPKDLAASRHPLPPPWDDPRWFVGGTPPRRHNTVKPLLHGDEYLADLHESICNARERVTIVGWCLSPMMPLLRDDRKHRSVLAEILRDASASAEVYVLLWGGAPVLFEPARSMVKEIQRRLHEIAPRVHFAADHSASLGHDQHQKAVTVDGRVAYVGGMDLTTFQGDRWDTAAHDLRYGVTWHDVQVRIEGEAVADVETNFCQRWHAVTGETVPPLPAQPRGDTPVQVIRTIPAGMYPFAPDGEHGIFHALTSAISRAERLVYLENQYLWAPEIVDALIEAMERPHSDPFRIVLVLPARALDGRYDNDQHVQLLLDKDRGRGIFHPYALYTGGPGMGTTGIRYDPIYVHAKVSIVDDEWLSVGSANLNRRGLATDAEMNIQSIDPVLARSVRVRLWAEHLGLPEPEVDAADPIYLVDTVWSGAAQTLHDAIHAASLPPAGRVHRYTVERTLSSRLLDLAQDLTLER